MPKLLTVLQAAQQVGLAPASLYEAIETGRLKGRRIMGRQMVHVDDLKAFMEKRKR